MSMTRTLGQIVMITAFNIAINAGDRAGQRRICRYLIAANTDTLMATKTPYESLHGALRVSETANDRNTARLS